MACGRLSGRHPMAPFDQLDLEKDWEDWVWSTAVDDNLGEPEDSGLW